jgi:hypothetical protein
MFRIDAKQAKKSLFFASKRKKFRFRFATFHFEAKMTAHPMYVLYIFILCIPEKSVLTAKLRRDLTSETSWVTGHDPA